jgi:hypothetical protein
MSKRNKIIYWVSTVWLALGMLSSGIVQLLRLDSEIEFILGLGYPVYFLTIIGVWKMLGVIALFLPKAPLLKEWAYAGFFFTMSGAALSHIFTNSLHQIFPSLLLLALTVVSWYFRPADKKCTCNIIN